MNTVLVFDTDKSLSAIGGEKEQRRVFGVDPVPVTQGIDEVHSYLSLLFQPKKLKKKHPVFDREIIEKRVDLKPKAKEVGIDALVLDTLSALGRQERKRLKGNGNMTKQLWGTYGEKMEKLFGLIQYLPIPVIVTTHIEISKDGFTGYHHQVPLVKGSMKDDLGSYFDVVVYCEVDVNNKTKKRSYNFLIQPTQTQPAKDRIGSLDGDLVPQDLRPIIKAYQQQGLQPKILICGKNGTGKTSALASLTGKSKHLQKPSPKKNSSKKKDSK